ncbi:hypothetical protein PspLS_08873 [Pyricularia sp. CBS 133598]|nr:hypothetical protein PspLS_08873 [Pyricularia sp. CBS 133598]
MRAASQEGLTGSTKGAKQGSGLPIPRVITQVLGDVSSADRPYCSPLPSPRAELFSQDRDKFRTNDALNLVRFISCVVVFSWSLFPFSSGQHKAKQSKKKGVVLVAYTRTHAHTTTS